jgi:hypothetical protein
MCRLAGPMRSFVVHHGDTLQRVAVIVTMNAAGDSSAFAEIARLLGVGLVDAAAFKSREIEDGSGTARLLAWT